MLGKNVEMRFKKIQKRNLVFPIRHDSFCNNIQHTGVPVINFQKRFLQQIRNIVHWALSIAPMTMLTLWNEWRKEAWLEFDSLGSNATESPVNVIDIGNIAFSSVDFGNFHIHLCMSTCLFRWPQIGYLLIFMFASFTRTLFCWILLVNN